jgi:hypothetical protein
VPWRTQAVAWLVMAALVVSLVVLAWRENERRYADLTMTGCFGDSARSAIGVTQGCGGARRLCRDAAPIIDWRHYCD